VSQEVEVVQGARLARRLGALDLGLIVIGSVIGSGIFRTPSVVAQRAPDAPLILAAWAAGGVISLFGAFVLGELGARRPEDCGMYAYLRDAFHPIVGFAFGWSGLLAAYSGGVAAAAILFSGYFVSLTGIPTATAVVAAATLAVLALLNALGVRQGTNFQNAMTVLKLAAVLSIIVAGFLAHPNAAPQPAFAPGSAFAGIGAFSVALIPVLFTFSGATVANFMAAESHDAGRALPVGLTFGMVVVGVIYVFVNAAGIRALGVTALAHTDVPASIVLSNVVGPAGARLASIAIALVTLAYMSNRMLTVPRLYHAMATDGLFFRAIAWIDPRTNVPAIAVMLQALVAIAIALSANYGHILNYVISVIAAFNGLLALALFVIRARDRAAGIAHAGFQAPWHPFSTTIFLLASWGVAIATCVAYPFDGLMGLAIVLSAVPIYMLWTRRRSAQKAGA
jgi:APA family basic amino acid/polyamine antiporter